MPNGLGDILIVALIGASSAALYLYCIRPALRWHRAALPAHALVAVLAASIPIATALVEAGTLTSWVPSLLLAALLAVWFVPQQVISFTGGPRPFPPDVDVVIERLTVAGERLGLGDVAGFAAHVGAARELSGPQTSDYVSLWEAFLAEERERRGGVLRSSTETLAAMSHAYDSLRCGDDRLPAVVRPVAVAIAAWVAVWPLIVLPS